MSKIPEDFNKCVKGGGKVKTLKPKEGKLLHICTLGGKTYRGEVKSAKEKKDVDDKETAPENEIKENVEVTLTESLSFAESEQKDGLEITYTVAEAGVSANGRRYSSKELETQSLKGMKMFLDHTYEADNAVGIIKDNWLEGRKLKAKAWVTNTAKHPDVIDMIRKGLIDSVSIGGKGDMKVVKEGESRVEEISNLQIKEVSFVGIPGVARAKITKIGG